MRRVLLTGMSGTGKSTLVEALIDRGYKAIDADDGWCVSASNGEWIWNEDLIGSLLTTQDAEVLVIAGCASNQGRFRHEFDVTVLLSAPLNVMLDRIRTRTKNPYGSDPQDLARIVDDHTNIEPLLRAATDYEVGTDRPLAVVVEDVVRLIG